MVHGRTTKKPGLLKSKRDRWSDDAGTRAVAGNPPRGGTSNFMLRRATPVMWLICFPRIPTVPSTGMSTTYVFPLNNTLIAIFSLTTSIPVIQFSHSNALNVSQPFSGCTQRFALLSNRRGKKKSITTEGQQSPELIETEESCRL